MVFFWVGELSAGRIFETRFSFVSCTAYGKVEKRRETRVAGLFAALCNRVASCVVFRSDFAKRFRHGACDGGNYSCDYVYGWD